jgi:Na+/phosphate symporter
MNEQLVADAAAEVDTAQAKVDELRRIEKLLWTELPAAQAALRSAEKKLRDATRPSKEAIREAELQMLQRKLNEARGGTQNV